MLARVSVALLAFIWTGMMPLHGQDQSPRIDATAPIATDRPAIATKPRGRLALMLWFDSRPPPIYVPTILFVVCPKFPAQSWLFIEQHEQMCAEGNRHKHGNQC